MKKIILASTSPRRRNMLKQLGLSFTVIPSDYEEKLNPRLKPKGQVEFLAEEKAKSVAAAYQGEPAVIISADTILTLQGDTLIKPKSREEARSTLERLSGKVHEAHTAFTIIDTETGKSVTKSSETKMHMKTLSKKEIAAYIETGEPMDRAGSYGLDGKGAAFVTKIEGDFYTIIGLPLYMLVEELKKFGITV